MHPEISQAKRNPPFEAGERNLHSIIIRRSRSYPSLRPGPARPLMIEKKAVRRIDSLIIRLLQSLACAVTQPPLSQSLHR